MEFGILGPLVVRDDECELAMGAPRQRALLALLLLRAGEPVPMGTLVDELWGERPPATATKAAQVYVSGLRKALGDGVIETHALGYVLRVDDDALDLRRFERLLERGRGLLVDGAVAEAREVLREALALWRGPVLADLRYEAFARSEIARLEELRLVAVEASVEAELALGQHTDAVPRLVALVSEHPLRERLRELLMLALYRSGRQTDALQVYRDARAALDEFGLEPGVALRRLEQRILTQATALELPRERGVGGQVPLPGPLLPESPFPFVGRERELADLSELLERAEGGEGALVLLAGEAGGGKTRLMRELARRAAARGALVLYGGSDAAFATPYQPLREWLEFLLRSFDREALKVCVGGCAVLARLVPELAELTDPPPPDPENDRHLLQSAAVELLRRLSGQQLVLVVADDLHWADVETLQLLRRLARAAPEMRLLVLGAFRERGERIEPALADTLADLGRLDAVTRVLLGNLSPEEMGEFVRVAAEAEPTPDLLFAIAELTDGMPLLVCELWRDLRQLDAIEVSEAGVRLTRPLSELQGTERIRDAVRARLQRLTPETAAVLELAAVAGPRFEPRVLVEAAALGQPALVAALAEAVGSGIVEELPGPAPACRFTHELVRRAVYDRITGIRRGELHLCVGEALERVHAADPASVLPELAHHFTLGAAVGGPERAVEYNLRAADAAIGAAAFSEASERVATALELGIADPQERARVGLELVYLLRDSGRVQEARKLLAAAVESATGWEGRRVAAHALMLRFWSMGNPDSDPVRMQESARRALATFADLGDPSGLAIAGRRLGMALRRGGRMAESRAALEEALVHANDAGGWTARRQVIGTLTYVLCDGPTPVEDAIRRCEELRDSGPRDLELDAVVNRSLAALLAMAGHLDEAQELGVSSSRLLDAHSFNVHSSVYRIIAAEQKELCGDRAGAEEVLIAKWQHFGRGPRTDARAMHAAYHLALLHCDEGRWDEAAHWLEYGKEIPVPEHFLHEAVLGLAARARVAAHGRRVDEGLALARRGVSLAEQGDMSNLTARTWLALAEVLRRSGRASESDAAVAAALRLFEEKGNVAAAAALRAGGHRASATV